MGEEPATAVVEPAIIPVGGGDAADAWLDCSGLTGPVPGPGSPSAERVFQSRLMAQRLPAQGANLLRASKGWRADLTVFFARACDGSGGLGRPNVQMATDICGSCTQGRARHVVVVHVVEKDCSSCCLC